MVNRENPWTLSVDGGEPVPCEFEARSDSGLKYMKFVVPFARYERVGEEVPIVLAGGGRQARGTGIIESVSVSGVDEEAMAVISALGPLQMLADEAVHHG